MTIKEQLQALEERKNKYLSLVKKKREKIILQCRHPNAYKNGSSIDSETWVECPDCGCTWGSWKSFEKLNKNKETPHD